MSESSEKKLLKKMLAKLKQKAIESQKAYLGHITATIEVFAQFVQVYDKMLEAIEKVPEKVPRELSKLLDEVKITLNLFKASLYFNFTSSSTAFGDLQLYLSSLEEYSAQLDGTLKEIFDAAKEEMEKLEAKRKEMEKRQPKYVK